MFKTVEIFDFETNFLIRRPKYVHLTNDQFYDSEAGDATKDGIYDLSTTTSSSTTNTITTSQMAHNRLMHDEVASKNHLDGSEVHHNGASTSKKSAKLSPAQQHYTNTANLVAVMMDDKAQDTEDHSFYMPLRRDLENGHHPMEYEGTYIKRNINPCAPF